MDFILCLLAVLGIITIVPAVGAMICNWLESRW